MSRHFKIFWVFGLFLLFSSYAARAEEILSWHDCIGEAAKNHPDLVAAEQEIRYSEAGRQITASTLYPQINSNLSASTARTDTGKGDGSLKDTYTYGLSGTQLLFDGKKTMNNVRAATENIKASKHNFRFTSATVRFRLRSAFIDLLKAQEMLRISEGIFNIRRTNFELITLRYESGLEHKGALLTADADLADAQYQILQAKRDLEVAQRELVKEMGRAEFSPSIRVRGDFEIRDDAKVKPDLEAITKNNPSLQQLSAQKNAADFSLRSAYANFSPTFSAQAGANKNGRNWLPKGDQWNLGLVLSLPIFEGGLRFAQVSQTRSLLNQLKANERSRRDGIILTLEQAWVHLRDTIDNLEVQRKSLLAAEERSRIAQAQYSTGFISFDNWTIIEDNLVQEKRAILAARVNALLAEANWIQAKGETLEYE